MGTGKPRISTAATEPADRVVLEHDLVLAELEHDQAVGELELAQAAAELELAQAAAELEHVQVAAELEHDRAVGELELARVAVELEHDLEVLGPARGHPRAQLAVALKTKSVTAAHRPDLVPLLAAGEDLAAAAAETTREPAAAEAVIAWEVAE
jgi:hypothetical protein